MTQLLDRILTDNPLIRALSYQSVLSAFGEGVFITGSAVYFTQIVGLSAPQVGLGLTIAGVVTFLVAVPLGKLADRVGMKRTWWLAALIQAGIFCCWPFAHDFGAYLAITVAYEVSDTWERAGVGAYRLTVFPAESRVAGLARIRASRNVGYALGALGGGLALAVHSDRLIEAVPLVTAAMMLINAVAVLRLPDVTVPHAESPLEQATDRPRSALHNRGFLATMICDGVLGSHQVLLNVVIPLWLVERTDAPRVLLAWLFGTNCVIAVLLQVAAARGVTDVATSLRAETRSVVCFVASCGIVLVTHDTIGWITIVLVWLAHVAVSGAELFESAGMWGLQSELSDPRRRGEYQGVAQLGGTLGGVWAPALYTYLAMNWGGVGWIVIAALVCLAGVAIRPAAAAAERYASRHFAPEPVAAVE